mmetsp:Transcript_17962/g.30215  ORF Transcript_17962/g.30215 Transcript_17962/m.30215 type:complete len:205 (+) Transcript_17962:831-1445(+)
MKRSFPLRLKIGCSFCCKMRMTSPGSISGDSSASPWKVIFCPWVMPFSTLTSRIFFSWITLFPRHCWHLSFSEIIWPDPRHSGQTDCICWTMPGPIWRIVTFIPEPWQPAQRPVLPDLDPWPLHLEQITFLESESFFVAPLYISSMVTFRGCATFSPLRRPPELRLRPPIPPPPPKKDSKMSKGFPPPPPPPPPMPSFSASSPY